MDQDFSQSLQERIYSFPILTSKSYSIIRVVASWGSPQPRDRTHGPTRVSCMAGKFFSTEPPGNPDLKNQSFCIPDIFLFEPFQLFCKLLFYSVFIPSVLEISRVVSNFLTGTWSYFFKHSFIVLQIHLGGWR